jgi:hypothetical protein
MDVIAAAVDATKRQKRTNDPGRNVGEIQVEAVLLEPDLQQGIRVTKAMVGGAFSHMRWR